MLDDKIGTRSITTDVLTRLKGMNFIGTIFLTSTEPKDQLKYANDVYGEDEVEYRLRKRKFIVAELEPKSETSSFDIQLPEIEVVVADGTVSAMIKDYTKQVDVVNPKSPKNFIFRY